MLVKLIMDHIQYLLNKVNNNKGIIAIKVVISPASTGPTFPLK